MANSYDQLAEILNTSTCPDIWKFYDSFPHRGGDQLPDTENPDTRLVVDAIVFATDILRATIIEQARVIRDNLKKV